MPAYALRQLNPYAGVLQVVETDRGRAFSSNGRVWRLQILAERPDHTWRSGGPRVQRQFFNWALWSQQEGLHKVSANPLLDIGAMQRAGEALVEALRERLAELPFALADRFEYWACDYHGRPVALIASTRHAELANGTPDTAWHASRLADHSFESPALSAAGIPNHNDYGPRAHASRLESEVRHRAQSRFWFERLPDGSGRRLDRDQRLAAAEFPRFGIATEWEQPLSRHLVRDYLDWLSPQLLLLPMPEAQRRHLEQQARAHAERVAELFRLYPVILQPELIEQARVEARLRRA